jgi:hypothetical protein
MGLCHRRTVVRFTVALDEDAAERLRTLARAERRDPRDQAALLLERALRVVRGRSERDVHGSCS